MTLARDNGVIARSIGLRIVTKLSIIAALFFGGSGLAFAKEYELKNEAQAFLIDMETKHNIMHEASANQLQLKSVLIPVDLLDSSDMAGVPEQIRRSVFVERNGITYYRWIFHPDDTYYDKQVLTDLMQRLPEGAKIQTEKFLTGYRTASRSLLILDTRSGFMFSMKTSTNQAGGQWRDKAQPVRYAKSSVLASRHVREMENEFGKFEFSLPLYEPGAMYNPVIDQAQVFRVLGEINNGTKFYLPVFSMFSSDVMDKLTAANAMTMSEVIERIGLIWGRAQAEWVLKTGLSTSSAHGQNFLLELDAQMRFTGRMEFRDFADAHVMESLVRGPERQNLLQHWASLKDKDNEIFRNAFAMNFTPYHGLGFDIEDKTLLLIYKGIRQGVKEQLVKSLGPWGLQNWNLEDALNSNSTALLIKAKAKPNRDIERVLELIRRKSDGVRACRFVHSSF